MKRLYAHTVRTLAVIMLAMLLFPSVLYAVGPVVSANVYDGKPATLTITSPENGMTAGESPVLVEGTVHNISQIMLYVDSAYSMTHPLDDGAETYSFTAAVSPGFHTLKLVAVNPYEGTTVEENVSFTFTPGAEPSAPTEAVKTVAGTAQMTQEYLQGQVDQASVSEPATFLSDVGYEIMDALDLVPTTSEQSMPQMLSRFGVITTGVALIILTNPMITLYHLTRYQLMQWNVHALPALVRHHAALFLRAGGVLLLAVGFLV
jgi:hypothetical protein